VPEEKGNGLTTCKGGLIVGDVICERAGRVTLESCPEGGAGGRCRGGSTGGGESGDGDVVIL